MAKTPAQIADAALKDLITETCEHVIRTRQELRRSLIYAAALARQASWDQYTEVCAVIDQAKTDDRSLDTDEYATAILSALAVSTPE